MSCKLLPPFSPSSKEEADGVDSATRHGEAPRTQSIRFISRFSPRAGIGIVKTSRAALRAECLPLAKPPIAVCTGRRGKPKPFSEQPCRDVG